MQVILQGSLRHFPAADLLAFLCGRGQKGTLDLENAGRRTRILYENDAIVWAESNSVSDALDAVVDAYAWDAGTFTLLDSVALPENARPLALTMQALRDEVKRRADYRDDTFFRVVENPAAQKVSLSGVQFKLLFRLATGRTLRELVQDVGGEREDVARQLKLLEQRGLVEVVPFGPETDKIPAFQEAEVARVERAAVTTASKSVSRRRTLVGSLTPDGDPDSVYPLFEQECLIGRAPGNGITIPDGSVSAQHAKIVRTPEGFVLEDVGSRNGTFVNGERVDKPRLLADGDVVRVGKIILIFNLAQEIKQAAKTEPDMRL